MEVPPFPKTPEALEKLILDMAQHFGVCSDEGDFGFGLAYMPSNAPFYVEGDFDRAQWPWVRLLREAANYCISLSVLFHAYLDEEDDDYFRALWSLSARSGWDILALLRLIDGGFGPQALVVGRSAIEAMEALGVFAHDKAVAREFVAARDPEEANAFWHRHLSKGKVRRAIGT
jgi:hypothetical protein